ncbi:MAG: hypothetical protein GY810_16360 [Aureispira sp.]|nr:hypothetical protein [Aureispira sp.]
MHELLLSDSPENSLLAIQLMQGTLGYSKTEAIQYVFDYHWKEDIDKLKFNIGAVTVIYWIGVVHKEGLGMGWEGDLILDYKAEGAIYGQEELIRQDGFADEDYYLSDYEELIRTHFGQQIPILLKALNL